jgi:hypothetical protein
VPDQPKTPARSIRVPEWLWKAAKAEAERRGETVTFALTRCLLDYTRDAKPSEPAPTVTPAP